MTKRIVSNLMPEANEARIRGFRAALASGQVCLHPTDTIPGLTFDPRRADAIQRLAAIKGRGADKSFIGLVPNLQSARLWWLPLPAPWDSALSSLWPGALSVVWRPAQGTPDALISASGKACLRVPDMAEADRWMLSVLQAVNCPLPTTSVNVSGEPPARTWADAVAFAKKYGIYVPDVGDKLDGGPQPIPSTIIEIFDHGAFRILRPGPVTEATISGIGNARTMD